MAQIEVRQKENEFTLSHKRILLGLVQKDLLVSRKYLLYACLYGLLMSFLFRDALTSMAATTTAMVYIVFMTLLAYEDKYKADILFNTLPIDRNHIILGKYLIGLICFLISIPISLCSRFIADAVFARHQGEPFIPALPSLLLPATAICFLISQLHVSISLPVYYRFGYAKSRIASLLFFLLFFLGLQILFTIPVGLAILAYLERQKVNQLSLVLYAFGLVIDFIGYLITRQIYRKLDL